MAFLTSLPGGALLFPGELRASLGLSPFVRVMMRRGTRPQFLGWGIMMFLYDFPRPEKN